MCGNEWRELGLTDNRLRPVLNRIACLKAVGLTIKHVGDDFLRRRITPLQKRDRFAWRYGYAADKMRLYLGPTNKLSVYAHGWLCKQLFGSLGLFKLPARVVPLNINFARD